MPVSLHLRDAAPALSLPEIGLRWPMEPPVLRNILCLIALAVGVREKD